MENCIMRKLLIMPAFALALVAGVSAVALGQETMADSTRQDLLDAMKGEAFAYLKYTMYAEQARTNGNPELAVLFERTAAVEYGEHFKEHAEYFGLVKGDADNIRDAIAGEDYETVTMYPDMAARATAAGDAHAAEHFTEVGRDEAVHRDAYRAELAKLGAN
jgi:rubrerythrin